MLVIAYSTAVTLGVAFHLLLAAHATIGEVRLLAVAGDDTRATHLQPGSRHDGYVLVGDVSRQERLDSRTMRYI